MSPLLQESQQVREGAPCLGVGVPRSGAQLYSDPHDCLMLSGEGGKGQEMAQRGHCGFSSSSPPVGWELCTQLWPILQWVP